MSFQIKVLKRSMTDKILIILGSARSDGHTKAAITDLDPHHQMAFVDLNDLKIAPFDYQHHNHDDDYLPLMKKVVTFDHIILATPVYWYTMSAQMKIFIDRLSDITIFCKDIGDKLKGKKISVLASYGNPKGIHGFALAFEQICHYMGIEYGGCFYYYSGKNKDLIAENKKIKEFRKKIIHTQ